MRELICLVMIFMLTSAIGGGFQTPLAGGLLFNSFDVPYEQRTSLNLTPQHPLAITDSSVLSFQVAFWENDRLGYLFNAYDPQGGLKMGLIYTPGTSQLKLVINEGESDINIPLIPETLIRNQWHEVSIGFYPATKKLALTFDGKTSFGENIPMRHDPEFFMVFGLNLLPNHVVTDVPRVGIRGVKITDGKGYHKHCWLLNESEGNQALDTINALVAQVSNPHWLIEDHFLWKKKITFETDAVPGIAYDPNRSRVLVSNKTSLIDYDIETNTYRQISYQNPLPLPDYVYYTLYHPHSNQLVAFDLEPREVTFYDESMASWSSIDDPDLPRQNHWHPARFVDPFSGNLMLLGGYGFFTQKNDLWEYDLDQEKWQKVALRGDTLGPRYLFAAGVKPSTGEVLIFGGFGNKKGRQELGEKNYYDLFLLDLKRSSLTKVWELTTVPYDFVPVNTLVIDEDDNAFYTLCYPHNQQNAHLQLLRFSLDQPEFEIVSDSIPYPFYHIARYDASLYYNKLTEELIAVTRSEIDNEHSKIDIYSLAFPPVKREVLRTYHVSTLVKKPGGPNRPWWWAIALLVASIAVFYLRQKRKSKSTRRPVKGDTVMKPSNALDDLSPGDNPKVNHIHFFGGFQVFDQEGNSIVQKFSPKLRELFCLIILNSGGTAQGITTQKLTRLLWPSSDQHSAKNTRGVSIQRLRAILELMSGIEVVHEENYWRVMLNEEASFDYFVFLDINRKLNFEKTDQTLLKQLLEITGKGKFLPQLQYDWLEPIKNQVTDQAINTLITCLKNLDPSTQSEIILSLANNVLIFDSLNDKALHYKLTALKNLGKHGQAKSIYSEFVQEYEQLYQEPYPKSFNDIV